MGKEVGLGRHGVHLDVLHEEADERAAVQRVDEPFSLKRLGHRVPAQKQVETCVHDSTGVGKVSGVCGAGAAAGLARAAAHHAGFTQSCASVQHVRPSQPWLTHQRSPPPRGSPEGEAWPPSQPPSTRREETAPCCGEESRMQCACTSASVCIWGVSHGVHPAHDARSGGARRAGCGDGCGLCQNRA